MQVPALLITGDIGDAQTAEAKALHIALMHKPIDSEDMLATIRRLLSQEDDNNVNIADDDGPP